jgi:diguanylate cyclase
MKPEAPSLHKPARTFALMLSVMIALSGPLVYFVSAYKSQLNILELQTQLTSVEVNRLILSNPLLWKFEELRLTELLARQGHGAVPESKQVFHANGELIASNNENIASPLVSYTMHIYDAGVVAGQLKVSRSLKPILARTALIAMLSSCIAFILFSAFRRIPVRVIKKAYKSLEDSEKKYRLLYENMTEAMALHKMQPGQNGEEEKLVLVDANPSCAVMLNRDLNSIIGSDSLKLFGKELVELARQQLQDGDKPLAPLELQLPGKKKLYNVRVFVTETGLVATLFEDITERKKTEHKIRRMAYFDILTGLPNRALFMDRLSKAIHFSERDQKKLAVLFLDLDHFKEINDTLGHAAGDQLLVEITRRLGINIRTSDTLSRFGGDEFVFVITGLDEQLNVAHVAQNLINAIQVPFHIQNNQLIVTTSIGIAVYPDDGIMPETLLRNADLAMYHSKESGRNNYSFYSPSMNQKAILHRNIEFGLRHALTHGELFLEFQPIINLITNRITGAEAFVHWNHPTRGRISPAEFIKLADETGLIIPVGEWVLSSVCARINAMITAGLPRIRFSVNVSNRQAGQHNFMDSFRQTLSANNTDPSLFEIELTESCLVELSDETVAQILKLRDYGIGITLEDFGTGYSSIGCLKNLQIDHLKIDRSLILNASSNMQDQAIIEAIIALSPKLGIQVIAEGVENVEQLNYLKSLGCKEAQGYYFYRPMSAEALEQLLWEQGLNG